MQNNKLSPFPQYIIEFTSWFLWRWTDLRLDGFSVRLPEAISARTLEPISEFSWEHCRNYGTAVAQAKALPELDCGLGFVSGERTGVILVELSNAVDDGGNPINCAKEVLEQVPTAWYYTPNGFGLIGLFLSKRDHRIPGNLHPLVSVITDEYLCCLGTQVPGTNVELAPLGDSISIIRDIYYPPVPAPPQLNLFGGQLPVAPPRQTPPAVILPPVPQVPASIPLTQRPDRRVEEPISLPEPEPAPSERTGNESQAWPVPKSFEAVMTAVLPFNINWLPEPFIAYVLWIAATLQIPVDFPAILVLAALGALALRRFCIIPKRAGGWMVFPNLWTLIVAEPGFMKSACMKLSMFALLTREKGGNGGRFFTSDTTVAKLQEIVAANPAGLCIFRDEIFGFFLSLNRKGQESDRQFYLEGWDGDTPFMVDRITRGTVVIPHLCLSIIGSLQPDKLHEFVSEALKVDDGFAARFQMVIMPDLPTDFEYIEEDPDAAAQARIMAIFDRVLEWPAEEPHQFRFDERAQSAFESWYTDLMKRVRGRKGLSPPMRSHLAKFSRVMPAIAGLIHVAEDPDSDRIPLDRARRAIELCEYLESHASRVYSRTVGYRFGPTSILAGRIKDRSLKARFTVREVYNHGWTGLGDAEAVRKALVELREAGWVRPCSPRSESTGGRPPETWEINPAVNDA